MALFDKILSLYSGLWPIAQHMFVSSFLLLANSVIKSGFEYTLSPRQPFSYRSRVTENLLG
jgi:hypothetical protein